ncbi:MAG: acyltransferase [bacterium]|nr:acyltransferase [bacterium]
MMKIFRNMIFGMAGLILGLICALIKKIRSDTIIQMYKTIYWGSMLKEMGEDVIFYKGVIIHSPDSVSIQEGSRIGDYVVIWGGGGVQIGKNVLIATHSLIISQTHETNAPVYRDTLVKKKIVISDNAWIGADVIILPGVQVGHNAIIGAGAVVTKDVPANDIVVGSPARSIKKKE